MRTVELTDGVHSSLLGFGCASILGSVDGTTSRRALEVALDNGINHFDLARSYGYGEAENFVGKVLGSRRARLVLTTKFGIKANGKARLFRPLKSFVRNMRKARVNRARGKKNKTGDFGIADLFHSRVELNPANMRISLEASLKALRTDYVDYFLVHEPIYTLNNVAELFETANRLKEEGKIRAWGLSYMQHQSYLHSPYLELFDILQFNNSPLDSCYNKIVKERSKESNIFFSPLKGESGRMSPEEKLKTLFKDYERSVVLCSMFNEKHIIENAKLAS